MMHAWLEAGIILGMAMLAALAVVPWLTRLFPMDPERSEAGGGLVVGLERPFLRAAGCWPPREMTAAD